MFLTTNYFILYNYYAYFSIAGTSIKKKKHNYVLECKNNPHDNTHEKV